MQIVIAGTGFKPATTIEDGISEFEGWFNAFEENFLN
jgi:hypothetical protein